jgi:HAD superfamily hydrolase (TIGR01509 family)
MNSFQGIVFDLDGVLVNSEPFHLRMWEETISQFDVVVEENWSDRFIGTPDTETAMSLITRYSLQARWEDLVNIKRGKIINNSEENIRTFSGVIEGLTGLAGFPKAVATSSSREIAEFFLNAAGLKDFFEVVITSDDVIKTKPDPECYLEACRCIGLDPFLCLAVEDSPAGIESAKRAGLFTAGVSTSYQQHHLDQADRIFSAPADVFSWFGIN